MKKQPTFNIIDGWNFGIGFFLAGLIGIPLILVAGGTVLFVVLSVLGAMGVYF